MYNNDFLWNIFISYAEKNVIRSYKFQNSGATEFIILLNVSHI